MNINLDETICWNERCNLFDTKKSSRCKKDYVGNCECQFDISFKSDSIKPNGEAPWK